MITTSTAGRTRLGAVATPLRAGAPGVGVTAPGVAARKTAATGVEPFGSPLAPRGGAVVVHQRPANAPKPDAQLRASVRPRRDL